VAWQKQPGFVELLPGAVLFRAGSSDNHPLFFSLACNECRGNAALFDCALNGEKRKPTKKNIRNLTIINHEQDEIHFFDSTCMYFIYRMLKLFKESSIRQFRDGGGGVRADVGTYA
jgi:hypothetical protein